MRSGLLVLGLAPALAAGVLTGCSAGTPAPDAAPGGAAPTVTGVLGDVRLELEVADTPEERATGLMGRPELPPGRGMVFRYDAPVAAKFYMYRVAVPLAATFVLDGRVVHTVVMPPCVEQDPQACPRYGPDSPFDTVVETAPATTAGVRIGDPFTLASD
jgi:uncharacterized membrane protein (UPF0127 family)